MKRSLLRNKRKKENWFKYIMSVSHLWLGLLSSMIVFVVCLSGSIYAFKNQIQGFVDRELTSVSTRSTQRVNLDSVRTLFEDKYGPVTFIQVFPESHQSILISSASRENPGVSIYYDPHSGKELGAKSETSIAFFAFILDLHRFLLAGDAGKFINGTAVLIFVYILFSGFILWLPKKIKKIGSRMTVRWRARFYRFNYDLHSVLGFYSLLLLLFMALTGLYVSFTWVKNSIIIGLGGDSIVISDSNLTLKKNLSNAFDDMLQGLSEEQTNTDSAVWTIESIIEKTDSTLEYNGQTTIQLPNENIKSINLTRLRHDNVLGFYVPDKIEFAGTGNVRNVQTFYSLELHEQFKLIAKPLHTGEIMGLPSIILYFLVSLVGCSLPITGFIIWWKKSGLRNSDS